MDLAFADIRFSYTPRGAVTFNLDNSKAGCDIIVQTVQHRLSAEVIVGKI